MLQSKEYLLRGLRRTSIKVCDRWRSNFEAFLTDMGPHPGKGWSIERINVNGDYEPSSCEWKLISKQSQNTRRTIRFSPGTQFDFWTTIDGPIFKEGVNWHLCRCYCGTVRQVASVKLKCRESKSCGCIPRLRMSKLAVGKAYAKKRRFDGLMAAQTSLFPEPMCDVYAK